jgi:general secretion pathway protein A
MSATDRTDYLAHWGLAEPPFPLEPDPRFAFEREDHREGLARMLFGLTQMGGLVLITGEIGCGKTTLAHALRGMLTGGGFTVVGVANPPRTAAALLGALLEAAGAGPAGGTAARQAQVLRARLAEEAEAGRRPVIAVDEAQRLDPRALDELRMLTNADGAPGTPAVLLGQPELSARVARIPQVAQRVVVRYHMRPMGPDEVDAYVAHRTRVAGSPRRLFTRRAATALHEETGGIPRLVNLLGANALFVGAARGEEQIGADTVRDVAEDRRRAEALADGGAA